MQWVRRTQPIGLPVLFRPSFRFIGVHFRIGKGGQHMEGYMRAQYVKNFIGGGKETHPKLFLREEGRHTAERAGGDRRKLSRCSTAVQRSS